MFYWVKSFTQSTRQNVTRLQNWKPFSLPKNFDPWVSNITGNKASQTCRVRLYKTRWQPLATPRITDASPLVEGSVRVSCGDLKIPANTGIIADICKNTDGIIWMRMVLRDSKKRDNYHEVWQAHGSSMWLARIGSTNRSQAKHLCLTDTYT